MARAGIKMGGDEAPSLRRQKNSHDIFATLDGAIEISVRSKKSKAVMLVKWLTKKSVEKIQENHQHVIEKKDAQLALMNDDLQDNEN